MVLDLQTSYLKQILQLTCGNWKPEALDTTHNLWILTLTLKAFSASISKRLEGPWTYISLTRGPCWPNRALDVEMADHFIGHEGCKSDVQHLTPEEVQR